MAAVPLQSLTLKPANPVQIWKARELAWTEWHRGLTLEEWMRREEQMDKCDFATNGNLTQWYLAARACAQLHSQTLLAPCDDPETGEIHASCETYRRKVAIGQSSTTVIEGPIMAVGYAIASVYVKPSLRRIGYAGHMMRLLHHVLASPLGLPRFPKEWGDPPVEYFGDAIPSCLYSEIGEFYTKCRSTPESQGWTIVDKRSTVWKTSQHTSDPSVSAKDDIKQFDERELNELLKQELLLEEISHPLSLHKPTSAKRFTFLPAGGPLNYHLKLFQMTPWIRLAKASTWPPTSYGAHLINPFSSNVIFAAWTLEPLPSPSRLIITRMRCDEVCLDKLVSAALDAAVNAGMDLVEVWGLPGELVYAATASGGRTFERDERWPSVMWYGAPGEDVEWTNNEE
ncbi:hypothetical protein FRB94_010348 [Tulasnella sp. JGI-2019a]|nr:hypothetical protein FRB93_009799 [Tulasnella sp. JGI-2019a]KAG8993839.1 hypothetical protein FRB94_010348 [Tulasnella sp. JGI-2019a]